MNKEGELKSVERIKKILGGQRLHYLGFDEVAAREAVKLPSTSDVAKADDIELQEIAKSMEDLITKGQEMLPMHKLLGLDKQLRSIRVR